MRRAISIALATLALALFPLPPLSAQAGQALLRLKELVAPSLDPAELAAIQDLVTAAIVELKAFQVLDAEGRELARSEAGAALEPGEEAEPRAADFLIGGSIEASGAYLAFTLEATRVSTGEKRSVTEALSDRGELVLAARRLTRRLFDREGLAEPGGGGSSPLPAARRPSLESLAGGWSGDQGVDRVTLYPDGRGIAFLSSGASMRIKASLREDRIVIAQAQPNQPEFYRSGAIDFATAREISSRARPWKWTFALSEDGLSLFGIKESVFVSRDEGGALTVDNDYARDALWLRTER